MVRIFNGMEALSKAAADLFTKTALHSVASRGRFAVALSGGQTPREVYRLLAGEPYREQVPWQQTHVFWGDERYVPRDDPMNNARMAFDAFLDHVPIPRSNIHSIPTEESPEQCAATYEKLLRCFFQDQRPRFDLIFLGLGEDGHTASLFPNTPILSDEERWVGDLYVAGQNAHRLTFTASLINQANLIVFLVFGSNKSHVLQQVLSGPFRPQDLPAQLVRPVEGDLLWLVDESAAFELQQNALSSDLPLVKSEDRPSTS
jgi:6-phosphogluconolactonase